MTRRWPRPVPGLGIGMGAVLALMLLAGWAVSRRDAARQALALATDAARPAMLRISGGEALVARNDGEAAAALGAIVADRGSAAGVRLSVRSLAAAMPSGFVAVDLEALGSESLLRSFARAVEGQRPIIRFLRWSIRPAADGSLRLEARAVAPVVRPR